MPGSIQRNVVVQHFGTPDVTDGSLNEPREREEHGLKFNERWHYKHPRRDPSGAAERMLYWRRYDYVGSMIRKDHGGEWQRDDNLPQSIGR